MPFATGGPAGETTAVGGAKPQTPSESPRHFAARRDERESLPVIMKIFIVADAWGKLKNNTVKFSTLRGELKRNLATREA